MEFWPVGRGSHTLHDKIIIHSPIGEHNAEGVIDDWNDIFKTIETQLKNQRWYLIEVLEKTAGAIPDALEEIRSNYYKIIKLGCVGIFVVSPESTFAESYLKNILIGTGIKHDFYLSVEEAISQINSPMEDRT